MKNKLTSFRKLILLINIFIFIFSLTGCEPLRKKFTRQKKKDKESSTEIIPILEPIDYAEKEVFPQERYQYHYSLWKVWYNDFTSALEEEVSNDKRERYLISEMIEQLQEMKKWINEGKQLELASLVDDLHNVLKEYERPLGIRSRSQIKRRVDLNADKVQDTFRPKVMEGNYIR